VQQHLPENSLSVQAPSSTNNDTLKIAIVVQQIVTEFSEALSEENKIMFTTKIVLNNIKWAARIHTHGLLKVITFNKNGIWRWRYELSKQLQDLYTVWLCSQKHKPHERFFQIVTFIVLTSSREEKAFRITM
jgi:hypothetical protein